MSDWHRDILKMWTKTIKHFKSSWLILSPFCLFRLEPEVAAFRAVTLGKRLKCICLKWRKILRPHVAGTTFQRENVLAGYRVLSSFDWWRLKPTLSPTRTTRTSRMLLITVPPITMMMITSIMKLIGARLLPRHLPVQSCSGRATTELRDILKGL